MTIRKSIAQVNDVSLLERKMKRNIECDKVTGCKNWSGSIDFNGYGQLSFEGRQWSAHRVSYELFYGPIPQDAVAWWVLHKCDNPACCNPDHLYLGTPKQNAFDCANRKRQRFGYRDLSRADERYGTVFYEFKGEVKALKELSEELNVNESTLDQRFIAGWPEKDISILSNKFKRHLSTSVKTFYRRFSGEKEVTDYLSSKKHNGETPAASTTEVSILSAPAKETDMNTVAKIKKTDTQTSAISIFNFGDHEIRVIDQNGDPWFVAKEVCDALQLTNSRVSLQALDDDEKADVSLTYTSSNGVTQDREVNIVSESGMYTLVLRCRDAVNKGSVPHQFRRWVTSEILPAIRKTGTYEKPKPRQSSVDERTPLRQYVEKMIASKKGMIYPDIWKLVHERFDVTHINQLTGAESLEAVEYLKTIEGEFIGKQKDIIQPTLEIHYPLEWWNSYGSQLKQYGCTDFSHATPIKFPVGLLFGDGSYPSAIGHLLNHLRMAGYDISGAWLQYLAFKHYIEIMHLKLQRISDTCQSVINEETRFRISPR